MFNSKWVKLFIQPDCQILVTGRPTEKGFVVKAEVMINGAIAEKVLYNGNDLSKAEDAFDNFNRHEAMEYAASNPEAELPNTMKRLEKVEKDAADAENNEDAGGPKDEGSNQDLDKGDQENVGNEKGSEGDGGDDSNKGE